MANNIELSENISAYIKQAFGNEFLEKYKEYILSDFTIYIRMSAFVTDPKITLENLKSYGIETIPIENIPNAYIVKSGKEYIGKTLEFILGYYYIQSLSSMIPPIVLDPTKKDVVLDLCAAPGSKSTQLAELMQNRGTLCVNEPNLNRVKSLMFNIDKMGFSNISAIKQKGELLSKFFNEHFDKILVDAPCSGLGILQKKGEVSNWWNLNQAEKIAELQFRLLVSAIKMLKPGGELVYSTCTLTIEENEITLNKILRKYPVKLIEVNLPVNSHPAKTKYGEEELNPEIIKAHRIIPWEINSEGFFVAKLKKTESLEASKPGEVKERNIELLPANHKKIKKYISDLSEYFGIEKSFLDLFKYQIKGHDIFVVGNDCEIGNPNVYMRIGRKFGTIDKNNIAHLHSNSIQTVAKYINKNILDITDDSEMRIYLNGGIIKKDILPLGQKIIRYNGLIIGTAIATAGGLKSQFPRNFRTNEIILPSEIKK